MAVSTRTVNRFAIDLRQPVVPGPSGSRNGVSLLNVRDTPLRDPMTGRLEKATATPSGSALGVHTPAKAVAVSLGYPGLMTSAFSLVGSACSRRLDDAGDQRLLSDALLPRVGTLLS